MYGTITVRVSPNMTYACIYLIILLLHLYTTICLQYTFYIDLYSEGRMGSDLFDTLSRPYEV